MKLALYIYLVSVYPTFIVMLQRLHIGLIDLDMHCLFIFPLILPINIILEHGVFQKNVVSGYFQNCVMTVIHGFHI